MEKLLKSRQFWTAVLALVQTIVLNYLQVPAEIWQSINAILVIVIAMFTIEDVTETKARATIEAAKLYSTATKEAILKLGKKE
jgi:hypothetical protein